MLTKYNQLTMQQKQQIVDAFECGIECRVIPQYIGVSGRAVVRVLSEAGINTKRRNRYTLNENYFDEIDSQVKAYLLGLIAADGCVTQTNYIAFESIDKELTELLSIELQYSGEIRIIKPQGYAPHYGCAYVNQGRSGGLICIVGSYKFTYELTKCLGMGSVEEHSLKKAYYWRIYSRKNIEAFYKLVYQQSQIGLQRKKKKIEEILGSYRRD